VHPRRSCLFADRAVQGPRRSSLSPAGASTTLAVAADLSCDEAPRAGELSSDSQSVHGNVLRIEGMRSLARDVGIWLPDGTHRGLFALGDEADAALCAVLVQ
jgi:hypothetical protein